MKSIYKRLLMVILCIALVIPQIMISNRVVVQGSSTGVCTANTLNIRTGPGTEYDKVTVDGIEAFLTKNQAVTILSENNGWYQIQASFQGKTVEGYCLGTYIKVGSGMEDATPTATVAPTVSATPTPEVQYVITTSYKLSVPAVINASELNIREKASTSGKVLETLKNNASVTITGVTGSGSDTWYKISTKGKKSTVEGYVFARYVKCTFSSGIYGEISTSGVVLKNSAGSNAADYLVNKKSVPIAKGTLVWLSGEETVSGVKYYRTSFTYNGTKLRGYVLASSITMLGDKVTTTTTVTPSPTQVPSTPSTSTESNELNLSAVITANSLNLRKSASTSSEKLESLTKNTVVKILSVVSTGAERWYYISVSVNGKATKGYVYSSYVAFTFTKGFYGSVAAESVIMQTAPGSGKSITLSDGSEVTLKKGTRIWLSEEQTIAGEKWFRIGLTLEGKATRGYAKASDITITGTKPVIGSEETELEPDSGTTTPIPTMIVNPTATPTSSPTPTEQPFTANGIIRDASALVVKAGPGYSSSFAHDANGNSLVLATGKEVKVYGKTYVDSITWYQISFEYGGVTYTGYVNEKYVLLDESSINQGDSTIPDSGYADSDVDFETKLYNEGFPEDYKVYLREIHAMYPNWEFVAFHTGLDWNAVIENEAADHKNLISNIREIGWKSLEDNSYNWKTDSFIAYDGSSWVTASKEAIAYYMDPRNFLEEEGIFQFEQLTYQPSYQNLDGVENILMNTPLYQSSYTYMDDTGMEQSITYGETFMKAAEYSGVSPYHLASRVKQEVVTGTSSVSNSATGTFSGFEGLYNFYNIGAYHSTVAGGAISNGLKYAKNGSTNASLNTSCLIPWNNRYRAIVGGGYYIGSSYINRGQDTIYLQKFNVTPTSTYSHQYMANVEAAYSESKKVFAAYTDVATSTIVFSIPVYLNMPETVCEAPGYVANPNNWLKTLQITDPSGNILELVPTFDLSVDQEYYLVLDSSYDMVNVLATTVSSKATIYGTGYIPLAETQNMVTVSVTAENGDIRYYNILISREN